MKVAINECFGGFSLSPDAVRRIAELKGRECYFFTQAGLKSDYIPATLDEARSAFMFWAFSVSDPNAALKSKDWNEMTPEERRTQSALYSEIELSNRDYERHDPDLIKTVEELGDLANGSHAKLVIVEIPNGVEYVVEEYDGNEHVAEAHRTWR